MRTKIEGEPDVSKETELQSEAAFIVIVKATIDNRSIVNEIHNGSYHC